MLNIFNPPAGLLGNEEEQVRQQMQMQGLLGLAAGLFQAGQPSPVRQGLGGAAVQGLAAGQQMASNTFDQALKAQMMREQMAEIRRKRAEEEAIRQFLPQIYQAPTAATQEPIASEQGTDFITRPGTPGGINYDALRQLMIVAPERGAKVAEGIKALQPEYITVGDSLYMKKPGGGVEKVVNADGKFTGDFANIAVGLYGTANANEIASKDPAAFNKIQQGVLNKVEAGRTSVTVSTEKSYGGALAGEVAKSDAGKFEAAQAAPRIIENVKTTRDILDKGNVYVGFGATQRLDLARAGDLLGVTGKDTKETIANTQDLFKNRAQATLDSIRSSGLGSGQGFSNKDREFLENARLGNITYSKEALQRQLDIEERVAKASIDNWNSRIKQIPADARTALGLQEIAPPQVKPISVRKFNPATGRIE